MPHAQILVVDDEPDIRQLVQEILEDEGYVVHVAKDGESARLIYAQQKPDLVLLDIWMPDIDGISLLKEWSAPGGLDAEVVIMSGHGTLETAVEATRLGAFDFVQKPLSLAKLLATVRKALETRPQEKPAEAIGPPKPTAEPLGHSQVMQSLRNNAKQAANSASPVMITGESGSGRATLARYIHQLSQATGELVMLDHGQANGEDAYRYLFGSAQNGDTSSGLLDRASGGVLFIPKLHKLSAKTLDLLDNALEANGYTPQGGTGVKPLDCRIICSAADNLEQLVKDGKVPGPLYFRLNVLPLKVPALRDRPEDIPELIRYFSDWFPNQDNLPYRSFSVSVQNRMRNHSWPGNVRELRNLVQRLLILGGETEVSPQEIDDCLSQSAASIETADTEREGMFELPLREAREQFERDYLTYQLKKAGGSVGKLSESVGMERTHLYRKLRSLGIDPKSVGNS
ncbi:MAG: sigma-54 dependent transcriptional regulator [Xanthomonadales bacterium]|nr:sigma-54 dependent transcriptional regulator [Xanthomonadales bacterium]